jgi:RNA polymerase sporulation-specific sigma factor
LVSFFAVLAAAVAKGLYFLVAYLTNNTFPLPLSEKEEQHYLERLKCGDEKARNVLIERNLRLVAHIVKKFDNTGEEIDDLISIGTIGLIKAINTFDQGKKTRLATYAARCIENEILMHFRSTRRTRTEVSLYDPIGVDKEGNELPLTNYRFFCKKWSFRELGVQNQGKIVFVLPLLFPVDGVIEDRLQQFIFGCGVGRFFI